MCRTAARRSSPRPSARRGRASPTCRIEVLIPDFQGDLESVQTVLDARPDVLNHNTETVPRLYKMARSGGRYARTLELLDRSRRYAPDIPTKTGLMVGLGEEKDEPRRHFEGSASRRLRDPDDRPVPAPHGRARADDALLPSRRIPRAEDRRARPGLRPRRVGPARPQLVPRARNGRRLQARARRGLASVFASSGEPTPARACFAAAFRLSFIQHVRGPPGIPARRRAGRCRNTAQRRRRRQSRQSHENQAFTEGVGCGACSPGTWSQRTCTPLSAVARAN